MSWYEEKMMEERRMRRAFGDEFVDTMRLHPIANKEFTGGPDENKIVKDK